MSEGVAHAASLPSRGEPSNLLRFAMYALSDTITALATPVGTAALAVIRVSGPLTRKVGAEALGRELAERQATYVPYRDLDGDKLDEGIAVFFAGPRSYTGEDSLELTCHGNPLLVQRILTDLLRRGCRMAEAGEFTRRAFTHGKLDLSQAEAVVDLIHARSERALNVANQQLNGSLGRHLTPLTDKLLEALARVEAYIDFPEEDLPEEDQRQVVDLLQAVQTGASRLLATRRYGELLRQGIRTVIIGEPNAGKSSLLNRLVGHERALVSAEPGTTRDFIEEVISIGPHSLRLIDTAGLNPSPAPLERLGMQKTLERAAEADLFLVILDSTRPHPTLPAELVERLHAGNALLVLNKSDLPASPQAMTSFVDLQPIAVSALTGAGLEALRNAIETKAEAFRTHIGEDTLAINARHAEALERTHHCLQSALSHLTTGGPTELLSSDLRGALDALGEIGGRVDNERMLDALFATFCIGK